MMGSLMAFLILLMLVMTPISIDHLLWIVIEPTCCVAILGNKQKEKRTMKKVMKKKKRTTNKMNKTIAYHVYETCCFDSILEPDKRDYQVTTFFLRIEVNV